MPSRSRSASGRLPPAVGSLLYAWKLLAAPPPRHPTGAWLAACVCFSTPVRASLARLTALRHCGCGRTRRAILLPGDAWGSFTLHHRVAPAHRRLVCSCGARFTLPLDQVTDDHRALCLACAPPVAADRPEASPAPGDDRDDLVVERTLPLPPLRCPSATAPGAEDGPTRAVLSPTLPRVWPPSPRAPEAGGRLEIGCPCGAAIVASISALRASPRVACPRCGRWLLGADRFLPPEDDAAPLASSPSRPMPLFPLPRVRLAASSSFWSRDLYDEAPFGEVPAGACLVEPGARLGRLTVGPEISYRPGEHHARCRCGVAGYARKEDLETGRLLSCPPCQYTPPPGTVLDVPSTSWDRLIRQARGRVVVWASDDRTGPDRLFGPIVRRWAARRLDVRVMRLDVRTDADLASRLHVTAVPSLLFFFDGACQQLLVGLGNLEKIARMAQASGFDDLAPPVRPPFAPSP